MKSTGRFVTKSTKIGRFSRAWGALVEVAPKAEKPLTRPSATETLRDDWKTIGADMWRVIDRERGRKAS